MPQFWKTEEFMSKTQKILVLIAFALWLVSLFVNLGLNPLHFEEPRRALISLEMLYNNNLLVPTEIGEFYYKKPPMYNWGLIFFTYIFQSYSEFSFRFFNVFSLIGMVLTLYWVCTKYFDRKQAIYASLFLGITNHLYLHSARVGEIDIFYSWIVFLQFIALFHFYNKKQYWLAFLTCYFFGAIGFLTKGFPSIVFLGCSIIGFLIYQKDFKRFFSLAHIISGLFCLGILGFYFYAYTLYGGSLESYFGDMWSQSSERTVLENSLLKFITHLFVFPLSFILDTSPVSWLLIFAIRKDFFKVIKENAFIKFCFYMFLANIWVYWISPGTRPRYVYMFYPLIVPIITHFFVRFINDKQWAKKTYNGLLIFFASLLVIAPVITPFFPDFQFLSQTSLYVITAVFMLAGMSLLVLHFKYQNLRIFVLIFGVLVIRFFINLLVQPSLAHQGDGKVAYDQAYEIFDKVQNKPLYVYKDTYISLTSVFYLEKERKQVLRRKHDTDKKSYFIVDANNPPSEKYKVFLEYGYKDQEFYLVKFL